MRIPTVIMLVIMICFFSCENKDEHFPIHLEAHFEGDNVFLNWSQIDIEDFEFYRIQQSSDGNHFYPVQSIDGTSSDIYDIATTNFIIKNYPNFKTAHYKVIAFGSKTYNSNEVLVDIPMPKEFSFYVDHAFLMPDENKILFLDQKTAYATLYLYDYAYDEIVNSADIYLNNSLSPYCFGKYNGNYEFYYFSVEPHITSTRKLHALDVLTLELDTATNMASSNREIATNSNGALYVGAYNGIGMLSRNNFVYSFFASTNTGYAKKLTYNSKSNKLIANLDRNYFGVYDLDNDGSVTSFNKTYLTGDSWSSSFYINNTSLCYQTYEDWNNRNGTKIIDINSLNQFYLLDAIGDTLSCNNFYSDGNFLYASRPHISSLYCYDINDLNYIKTLNCRVKPDIFIIDEKNLFVIERDYDYKITRFEIRKLD